jgi:hypothetical protein
MWLAACGDAQQGGRLAVTPDGQASMDADPQTSDATRDARVPRTDGMSGDAAALDDAALDDAALDDATRTDAAPTDAAQADVLDTTDDDGDGVWNAVDNCPADANPGQADRDADGAGDACDVEPERFGYRLGSSALLLVGGAAMNESNNLRGSGTTAAHTSANPLLRLSGALSP